MSKKNKKELKRIIIAAAMFVIVFAVDKIVGLSSVFGGRFGFLLPLFLYFAVYAFIGYDVLFSAARNIVGGRFLDEKFLMSVASLGAFTLAVLKSVSGGEADGYEEACAVMLLYQLGEFFQHYATGKSRESISNLMALRPDYANVLRDEVYVTVDPEEVKIGEIIKVEPGEKIPLDGKIISGETTLDLKALTGEFLPVDAKTGDKVMSGSVNGGSTILIEVECEFYNSTVGKILELVESSALKKSKSENFIAKFAKYYTPIVVFAAIAIALIPSLFLGEPMTWIYRALNFLVISCPCALVISVPLAFVAGMGKSSASGILIKGGSYIEAFNKANVFVFDKTGTITEGSFYIDKITPSDKKDEILRCAAIAECHSNHPIAAFIKKNYDKEIDETFAIKNFAGKGIMAQKDGETILCGNAKLLEEFNIGFTPENGTGTAVYVAKNGEFLGSMLFCDKIKEESKEVINKLNDLNATTIMLTGDNEAVAAEVAKKLSLSTYRAALLPSDKVDEMEKLLAAKSEKDVICFFGDGINDAPVLMRADIGVAMGAIGSDAAIEASDVVFMKDDLRSIFVLKKISKKTMNVVWQNIIFSLAVKVGIMLLSGFGMAGMWLAVFGDVGVAALAILNSMRISAKERKKRIKV